MTRPIALANFFNSYFSDDANSKTVILLYYDSYLFFHNLEILDFEELSNYSYFTSFCNPQKQVPKAILIKRAKFCL